MLIAPRCETGARYPHPICVCGEFGQSPNTPSVLATPQEERKGDHVRFVKQLDGVLGLLVAEREHTVRQAG